MGSLMPESQASHIQIQSIDLGHGPQLSLGGMLKVESEDERVAWEVVVIFGNRHLSQAKLYRKSKCYCPFFKRREEEGGLIISEIHEVPTYEM